MWKNKLDKMIISRLSPNNKVPFGISFVGIKEEKLMPINNTGIATKNPASGPAIPMSNKAFLLGMGSLIEITAPIVPKGRTGFGGSGMKKGREAATLCLLDTK